MTSVSHNAPGSAPATHVLPKRVAPSRFDSRLSVEERDGLIARLVTSPYRPVLQSTKTGQLIGCLDQLPCRTRTRFLLTPAGFLEFLWPSGWDGSSGWQEQPVDVDALLGAADTVVNATVTPSVLAAAQGKVDYLVVGIDGRSADGYHAQQPRHAEFVYVYDLAHGRIVHRTGKSFPTSSQADMLVHFLPIEFHGTVLGGERVLLLVCHDLAAYSARGAGTEVHGGPRSTRTAIREFVRTFDPTVVLHLVHAIDSLTTWHHPRHLLLNEDALNVKVWETGVNFARYDQYTCVLIDPRDGSRDNPGPVLAGSSCPYRPELDVLIGCEK